jgi:murein DD-endopeptidase MepM/ murein hydrolase activator NlpD
MAAFLLEPHAGIDIPTPKEPPVLSAGPGVTWAGYGMYLREENRSYGIAVAISTILPGPEPVQRLCHLMKHCHKSQREAGEKISAGRDWRVSGPHSPRSAPGR